MLRNDFLCSKGSGMCKDRGYKVQITRLGSVNCNRLKRTLGLVLRNIGY